MQAFMVLQQPISGHTFLPMLSRRHILALGFLPGITMAALRALAESGALFDEIVHADPKDLADLGLRRAAIGAMRNMDEMLQRADAQMVLAEQHGAAIVQFWDPEYPSALRAIYAAPVTLYVRGVLRPDEERAVAIVGTRAASVYGTLAAERYAEGFASAGVTVVSGLARGIDMAAHTATLKAGGRTIAVVASGLDQIQPSYAALLAEKIARQGAVVSEYPFGVKALRPYFPQRNRIISGIASGTVIVESDQSGGAMITAGFAFDQDRDLFAVPGPISSPRSRGPNLLIRTDRARLTQSPDDVLEILGYGGPALLDDPLAIDARSFDLNLFEQQVYTVLSDEPMHIDAICVATGLASSEVLVNLLTLEFKGLARQMAGTIFVRG